MVLWEVHLGTSAEHPTETDGPISTTTSEAPQTAWDRYQEIGVRFVPNL